MSSGARKDLLILFFVRALLQISLDKNNKGANNKIKMVINQIDDTIKAIPPGLMATIYKWVQSKLDFKMNYLLTKLAQHEAQLEILALHLLQVNFEQRPVLLHIYKWYQEPNNYVEYGITKNQNGAMYKVVVDSISYIKG